MCPTDMSAPYPAFEACPSCGDAERCWYWGCCLNEKSQAEKEKMEADLSLAITQSVKAEQDKHRPDPRKDYWSKYSHHPRPFPIKEE